MVQNKTNLDSFFGVNDWSPEHLRELVKSDAFQPVGKEMTKKMNGFVVPDYFFEKMIGQVNKLLDIDICAILVSAWSPLDELDRFLDTSQYAPEEVVLLPLAEHTVTSVHHPSLKPTMNEIPLGELVFTIQLELDMKGVILEIQNGRIMKISMASCEARGALKFEEFVIFEKDGHFDALPGSISLGEGIPIKETVDKVHQSLGKIRAVASVAN